MLPKAMLAAPLTLLSAGCCHGPVTVAFGPPCHPAVVSPCEPDPRVLVPTPPVTGRLKAQPAPPQQQPPPPSVKLERVDPDYPPPPEVVAPEVVPMRRRPKETTKWAQVPSL